MSPDGLDNWIPRACSNDACGWLKGDCKCDARRRKDVEPVLEKREKLKEVTGTGPAISGGSKGGCFKPEKKD